MIELCVSYVHVVSCLAFYESCRSESRNIKFIKGQTLSTDEVSSVCIYE